MCLLHCSWLGRRRSPDEPWAGSADATGQIVVVGRRGKTIQVFHCAKLDLILARVLLVRCFGIGFSGLALLIANLLVAWPVQRFFAELVELDC